jgi:hypothetical protein
MSSDDLMIQKYGPMAKGLQLPPMAFELFPLSNLLKLKALVKFRLLLGRIPRSLPIVVCFIL